MPSKSTLLLPLLLTLTACNRNEPTPPAQASAAPPSPAPAQVPVPPPAPAPTPRYLTSMSPDLAQVFTDGTWGFGGNGTIGNLTRTPITVQGKPYPHGLGVVPPSNGASRVVYTLDKKFATLKGKAALNDTSTNAATTVTFRINDDSHELWKSTPRATKSDPVEFSLDVSNADRIELLVDCPGSNNDVHAVWLDPLLIPR